MGLKMHIGAKAYRVDGALNRLGPTARNLRGTRARGCFMIMGSFGQIAPETAHDHGLRLKYLNLKFRHNRT